MRSLPVVVIGKLTGEVVQVTRSEHDKPIEALDLHGLDEPLHECVEVRGEGREPYWLNTRRFEGLIDARAELGVSVTQQHPRPFRPVVRGVGKRRHLLGNPGRIRIGGTPGHNDTPGLDVHENKDERLNPAAERPDRFAHKVTRPQRLGMSFEELVPRGFIPLRARRDPGFLEASGDGLAFVDGLSTGAASIGATWQRSWARRSR